MLDNISGSFGQQEMFHNVTLSEFQEILYRFVRFEAIGMILKAKIYYKFINLQSWRNVNIDEISENLG